MSTSKNVALVTGASSGIGREMALLLAAQKHPLMLTARNQHALDAVAEEARREHGVSVWTFAVDLSEPNAARAIHAFTEQNGIEVEVLINNAGVGLYGEHTELDSEGLSRMLQLNVTALADLSMLFAAPMKRRKHGRILNVASTAAYQPTPFFAAYGASKAFVLNFSEALAMELADHGVVVSCLSPGPTDTAFFATMDVKGDHTKHFAKSERQDARAVAQIGLDTLAAGKLSRIVGTGNYWRAWSSRFAPRSMVAKVAKGLMRPQTTASESSRTTARA